jgi:ABC-type long-subunit fatty acid transport system fused permease/ATPase subunit
VFPHFVDLYETGTDWHALAWLIHDRLPYSHLQFFPKLAAFNIQWHERPRRRTQRPTVADLFDHVRTDCFRLYFHYAYFNVFRGMYLQADNIFAYLVLIPTIAAGKITFGILQQILTAFSQVSNSFQYLINSWTTIVELVSIRKRLAAFEAAFEGRELPPLEREDAGAVGR